jgi:DnaJ-domain-containing protein 1
MVDQSVDDSELAMLEKIREGLGISQEAAEQMRSEK